MNQFWETPTVNNQYAPIKLYEVSSPKELSQKNIVSVLTQRDYQSKPITSSSRGFIHCHSFLELLYIRDDNVMVQINGDIVYANYGDIFLINAYDVHDADGLNDQWVILIDTTKINHLPEEVINGLFPTHNEHKWIKNSERGKVKHLHSLCDTLVASLKNSNGYGNLKTTGSFYLLLDELYSYSNSVNFEKDLSPMPVDNKLIYNSLNYLEKNYMNEISLEEISNLVGFSKNYFCRFFKRVTGKSFVNFLNEMRCQRARDLLVNSKQPITQIALDTGFSSTSYFSRKFKEYWGASPRELRNKHNIDYNK